MSRLLSAALLLVPALATAAPPGVTAVAYHPKENVVAFASGGDVRLFNCDSGVAGDELRVQGRVTALAFAPGGTHLAIACGESGKTGLLSLIPVSGTRLAPGKGEPLVAHKDATYALAFTPDGKTVASAGYDRVIHLWDVPEVDGKAKDENRGPRLTLKDHSDAVYGLSFHPDGKLLASAGADRAVKVWDVATGKRLYTLGDATDWVYAVAWSPDKKHLSAAGVDKSVRVWAADSNGGKLVNTAFAHEKPVWRLAYMSDGKTLFTAGEDRAVKSWDALKLTEQKVYDTQPDAILDFALRSGGKQFAIARFDGAAVLIETTTGKVVHELLPKKAMDKPDESPVFTQPAKPLPPKVMKLTPDGGTRGKTTRVTVTGANLDQVRMVVANHPGVKVKLDAQPRSPMEVALDVTIGEAVPVGAVQLTFSAGDGTMSQVAFVVDRFEMVNEDGNTDSARNAMRVKQNTTIVGTIDRAGDMDYFRLLASDGDRIGVQVIATEIGSKLDPVLVLTDEAGTILAEGASSLGFAVRKAGTYAVGIRDREFRGGTDFTYRLHIGNVPVVTGVFPLAVQRGRATSVHVSGVNLGTPNGVTVKVVVPADAKPGSRVPVPVTGIAVNAIGKAEVTVTEFPAVVLDPVIGGDIRVPGSADGIFTKPNEAQTAHFSAKKDERLIVEVLAQRAGSPVDSVIEVLDSTGKPVPLATLRCTAKTTVTFRDHDSRGAGIRLDAWNELAIDDYLFVNGELIRILALPKGPDDDCQFYQAGGQRVGWLGTTPTHHSFGETMYKVELHPPGKKFPPNGMPVFTLAYRNDDGGLGYGKDSRVFFDPPADGTYQVRVTEARGAFGTAHSFRVTVRPPKPDFTMTANVVGPVLLKAGSVPVTVSIDRADGFDGAVTLRLKNLPQGFTAPPTTIEAGQQNTTFPLFATADAVLPDKAAVLLVATATVGGKEVVREQSHSLPAKLGTGDIVTTLKQQTVSIVPGKEARFRVEIERQGKFAGRVPIEVKGLPHGVRVLDIGLNGILITERETSREVVLYAEPWVKPMERPIIVIAKREGTASEYGAKSLLLEVKK